MTGRPDYDNATFAMFIGSNPVVSHGHTVGLPNPRGAIRDLAQRAEVWIVDPRRTETARMATHHLAPRPGTDYAVLAFLVREVLRDGADHAVPTQDVDRLAAAVEPFTLKHSANVADVPEEQLTQLLASIRRSGRIAVDTGTGITMSPNANVTQWLCTALLVLTGSMNRTGGVWFIPGSPTNSKRSHCRSHRRTDRLGQGPAAVRKPSPSFANGRAPYCPTRSTRETSARFSTSAAASSPVSRIRPRWCLP